MKDHILLVPRVVFIYKFHCSLCWAAQLLHVRFHCRTHQCILYEYYLSVGGTNLLFYWMDVHRACIAENANRTVDHANSLCRKSSIKCCHLAFKWIAPITPSSLKKCLHFHEQMTMLGAVWTQTIIPTDINYLYISVRLSLRMILAPSRWATSVYYSSEQTLYTASHCMYPVSAGDSKYTR